MVATVSLQDVDGPKPSEYLYEDASLTHGGMAERLSCLEGSI